MNTKTIAAIASASTLIALAGCQTGYGPREQARGTEITTHGLDVQDVERAAIELSESLIASNYITREGQDDGGEPAAIAINRFVNNSSQVNIDRDRVTNRIMQTFINSRQAVGYTPGDFETLASRGTLPDRSYILNAKIYEDVAEAGRDLQVSYIFQMQLLEYNGDGVNPIVWVEERRMTSESRRPR